MQPLLMVFDDLDSMKQEVIKSQFMLGEELMAAPILEEDSFRREVYFPDHFYDFHSGARMLVDDSNRVNITNYYNDLVPLYLRAGWTVITQNTKNVKSTADLSNKLVLKAALDDSLSAKGSFILLSDLSNDEDIIKYCISANCIADLRVHME